MKALLSFRYILVFLMLTAFGCEETILDQGFTIGREAAFKVNQLYTSDDGQYTLKITEVSDSRCPEGVVCVWSGEVTIKGEFSEKGNKSLFEIHSVMSQTNVQPDGFTVKIVDAKPYPKYGTESKPEDLIVTLLIQKESD